jgi:transcriptional regulator with PAS, ATPase and Fis domain
LSCRAAHAEARLDFGFVVEGSTHHRANTRPISSSSLEELEREQIVRVLAQSPTLQDVAEALGINVTTLWRKRKRYNLD